MYALCMYDNTFSCFNQGVHAIANFSLRRYTEHNIMDLFELCVHALARIHIHKYYNRMAMVGYNK